MFQEFYLYIYIAHCWDLYNFIVSHNFYYFLFYINACVTHWKRWPDSSVKFLVHFSFRLSWSDMHWVLLRVSECNWVLLCWESCWKMYMVWCCLTYGLICFFADYAPTVNMWSSHVETLFRQIVEYEIEWAGVRTMWSMKWLMPQQL